MDDVIVDLSKDDLDVEEVARKDYDSKKWQDLKKFIPFLEYMDKHCPEKNPRLTRIMDHLKSQCVFPQRIATLCEGSMRQRYDKLKSTMSFPPHIVELFAPPDNTVLISDDDEPVILADDVSPSNVESNIRTKNLASEERKNIENVSKGRNSNSKKQLVISVCSPLRTSAEDGEISSDNEEIQFKKQKSESKNKYLKANEADGDDSMQHTFNKIDRICADRNDLKKEEAQLRRNKKPDDWYLSLLSPVSEDEDNIDIVSHKEKRKKHNKKHKKHKKQTRNRYLPEEKRKTKGKEICRDTGSSDEHLNLVKSRNKSKEHTKSIKRLRQHSVSDDDEIINSSDVHAKPELVKAPESALFNRRETTRKDNLPKHINSDPVGVILIDSDGDADNSPPTTVHAKSGKQIIITTSPIGSPNKCELPAVSSSVPVPRESASPVSKEASNLVEKSTGMAVTSVQDLNNMDLDELSEVYSKLRESTGIELEELLRDLMSQSSADMEQIPPTKDEEFYNQTDFNPPIQLGNLNNNNFQSSEINSIHFELELEQQQKLLQQQQLLHLQHLQQQQHLQHFQQQQQQQQEVQPQCAPYSMGSDQSVPYPYRNSLNLKDPRIVQQLKQIKDSRIHSDQIRDKAKLIIWNLQTQNKTPTVEVTSKTARTYGEHKRLREIEQQTKLERQNIKRSTEVTNNIATMQTTSKHTENIRDHDSSRSGTIDETTKSKPKRKDSSGSESGRKTPKSIENEKQDEEIIIKSSQINRKARRRIESSSSENNESLQESIIPRSTMDKIVSLVVAAVGEKKESNEQTSGSQPRRVSKSRRISTRLSSVESGKSDAKSPTSKKDLGYIVSKSNKEVDCPKELGKTNTESISNDDKLNVVTKKGNKGERPNSMKERRVNSTKTKTSPSKQGSRELNNLLNCSFIDIQEMFEKNSLPTVDGKRRCTAQKSSLTRCQLDSHSSDTTSDGSNNVRLPRKEVRVAPITRRRQTCGASQGPEKNSALPFKLVIRRMSESGKVRVQDIEYNRTSSDCTDQFDYEEEPKVKNIKRKYPFTAELKIKLRKLSPDTIRKSLRLTDDKLPNQKNCIIESHASTEVNLLVKDKENNNLSLREIPTLIPFTSRPIVIPSKPPSKSKYLNVDIGMTLTSTKTCVICKKRPFDLTNHYVAQHKVESYISRISSAEIENLEANIILAIPSRKRYKVTCAFCQDELEDLFVNFHAHYSYHTGEFGFKCDVCQMIKPYREDIRSHQLRSSKCRNSKIRTNYLYSSDLTVIYLYVCKLCNFVQLNEANVHKHHRDHHGFMFDEPQHVKKCIIAAIESGEVVNEILPITSEEWHFKDNNLVQEQEFVHEFPLDIKDVLMTQENKECGATQELNRQQSNLPDCGVIIKEETPVISADTSDFEKLLNVIKCENLPSCSKGTPSPEALLEQLYAPASNIMTVIHQPCGEKYQPDIEFKPKVEITTPDKPKVERKQHLSKVGMRYTHFDTHHNYFGLYKCLVKGCWFSTNKSKNFLEHCNLHTNDKRRTILNCPYCPVRRTCADHLVRHVRRQHSISGYQCSECSYRSMVPGNVKIHRRISHKDSTADKCIYECTHRTKTTEENLITMRDKMIDNVTGLKCPDCSSIFYAVSSIKLHIKNMHPLTFETFNFTVFNEFACIYCNEESNSKNNMQIHLALEHPDEVGYVAERKLQNEVYGDVIENLNMINISLHIPPADIHAAHFKEFEERNSEKFEPISVSDDASTNVKQPIPEESSTAMTFEPAGDTSSLTDNKTTKEELIIDHIKHLLDLLSPHFDIHNRHCSYICFHCIRSLHSRSKIEEHFSAFHENCTFIEKTFSSGLKSYYIFKKDDAPILDWVPVLENFAETIRCRWIERLKANMNFTWVDGLNLEEIEIPKYTPTAQARYKCLRKSCCFVAVDENALDYHLKEHEVPPKYTCSHCDLNLIMPTWEDMKNHKMLHKNDLYICCVCKFIHHNRSGISKHIDNYHNSRDVPVISMNRDEMNYKISLAIFLTPRRSYFTTSLTCFCCGKEMKNSATLALHLRTHHAITLCQKCELCDKILLTPAELKTHREEHGMQIFRLKYDVLTTILYNLKVNSMSPLTIVMTPVKGKRAHENAEPSSSKIIQQDKEPPVIVKEEVVIKSEYEEEIILEEANASQISGCLIKCVNIEQLVVRETVSSRCTQAIEERAESQQLATPPTAACFSNQQSFRTQQPHSIGQVRRTSQMNIQSQQLAFTNDQGSTVISRALPYYKGPSTVSPQSMQAEIRLDVGYRQHDGQSILQPQKIPCYSQPIAQQTNSRTQICRGVHISEAHCSQQNASALPNSVGITNNWSTEPVIPEIAPICENCKMECTDFSHLKSHFVAVHASNKNRFLFRIVRKVQCVYCPYNYSVTYLHSHFDTFHPGKAIMCRSVTDHTRCGMCHEVFTTLPSSNSHPTPICACPSRQRAIADCLDLQTLTALQNFGKEFTAYLCILCTKSFHIKNDCVEHIARVHGRVDVNVVQWPIKNIMYMCNSCDKTTTKIREIIEHIRNSHFSGTGAEALSDRMVHYGKIGVIYPHGLVVCISDLRNTSSFDEASFQQQVQCVEAQYNNSVIKTIIV